MKSIRNIAVALSLVVLATFGIGASSGCAESRATDIDPTEKVVKVEKVKPLPVPEAPAVDEFESNDDLKSESRNHTGFDKVSIGGAMIATINAGQSFEVTVEAKADVLPKVISKVEDGRLIIKMEKNWWKSMKKKYKRSNVRVTVSLPALKDVDISGASKATVAGINNDKLSIDISGASDVKIEGTARDVEIDLSGASNLRAGGLYTQIANMDLSGASRAEINVASSLDVDASGASSVKYIGEPSVRKDTSGASSVYKN